VAGGAFGFSRSSFSILLTHSIPLLIAFLVMGTHLLTLIISTAARLPGLWGQRIGLAIRETRSAIVSLVIACLASLYVLLFVSGAGSSEHLTLAECLAKVRKLFFLGRFLPFRYGTTRFLWVSCCSQWPSARRYYDSAVV
jgi:hypothetical protein